MTTRTADELARIVDEHNRTGAGWGAVQALLEHIATEQSRIDAAVAKERERCAALEEGLRDAAAYLAVFVSIYEKTPSFRLDALHKTKRADYRAALKRVQALVSPTPATEEGA